MFWFQAKLIITLVMFLQTTIKKPKLTSGHIIIVYHISFKFSFTNIKLIFIKGFIVLYSFLPSNPI